MTPLGILRAFLRVRYPHACSKTGSSAELGALAPETNQGDANPGGAKAELHELGNVTAELHELGGARHAAPPGAPDDTHDPRATRTRP